MQLQLGILFKHCFKNTTSLAHWQNETVGYITLLKVMGRTAIIAEDCKQTRIESKCKFTPLSKS